MKKRSTYIYKLTKVHETRMVHTRCINKNLVAPFDKSVNVMGWGGWGSGGEAPDWGIRAEGGGKGAFKLFCRQKQFGLIAMHQCEVGV